MVGEFITANGQRHAFLWQNGVMNDLNPPGAIESFAIAINDNGQVVGDFTTAANGPVMAFLWDNGVTTDLGTLGGSQSFARAINDAGAVVGGSSTANGSLHGFLWENGVMKNLDTLPGVFSNAISINELREVLGSSTTAFLWQNDAMVDLGSLEVGLFAEAFDGTEKIINNSGQVVGVSSKGTESHAFLVAEFRQCTGKPRRWGGKQYAFHVNTTMCKYGCATTSLAMALNAAGLGSVPVQNTLLTGMTEEPDVSMRAMDPGYLNDYMTSEPASLAYTLGNDVDFLRTVGDLNSQLARRFKAQPKLSGGIAKALMWVYPPGTPGFDETFVDQALSQASPVIVSVDSLFSPTGCGVKKDKPCPHFVVITGKQGTDYIISDPAGCDNSVLPAGTSCTPGGPLAVLLSTYNNPIVRGYVQDPSGDLSSVSISASKGANVVLIDPGGRRTGIDPATGASLYEIPNSTFFADELADDEIPGGTPIGGSQQLYVTGPAEGGYTVVLDNPSGGPFTLSIRVFSQDGSSQAPIMIQGTAAPGVPTSYNLTVRTAAGGAADTVAPTTAALATPGPNTNGWNNSTVTVTLSAIDDPGGTGVKQITYDLSGAQTGSAVVAGNNALVSISTEGITTLTFFAVDNAGNREPAKALILRIDKTLPTVNFALPTPAPNAAGWNNTDVSILFTANDNLSGVASTSVTSPLVLTTEGAAVTGTVTATDQAGNSATFSSPPVRIDKTSPTVTCMRVPPPRRGDDDRDGRLLFQVTASDTLSQVANITLGTVKLTNGEIIRIQSTERPGVQVVLKTDDDEDRDAPRIRRFRVERGAAVINATDNAGNVGTAVCPLPLRHDDDDNGKLGDRGKGQERRRSDS